MKDLVAELEQAYLYLNTLGRDSFAQTCLDAALMIEDMRKNLAEVRYIVAEASITAGFNPTVGDWATRLYENNGEIGKLIGITPEERARIQKIPIDIG